MSGIFDRMNRQGKPLGEVTIAPANLQGLLLLKLSGLRTNAQLRDDVNASLAPGPVLSVVAETELLDFASYISSGTGEAGQLARLSRIHAVAGIWETGQGSITEAEARTMTGVTFS